VAHDPLVVVERELAVDAGQTLLADLLAVVALVDDRAAAADPAHRQDARRVVAGAVVAVVALLALDRALRDLLVAGVIRLLDPLVGGRLALLELTDPVVGTADLGAHVVVALARGLGLALLFLVEVGLLRARLLGDVAVLVGQELRVVWRLLREVLVRNLDHRHVRRRRLRLLLLLLGRRDLGRRQLRRRLDVERDVERLLVELLGVDRRDRLLGLGRERLDQLIELLGISDRDVELLRLQAEFRGDLDVVVNHQRAVTYVAGLCGLDRIAGQALFQRIPEPWHQRMGCAHRVLAIAGERRAIAEHGGDRDRRALGELHRTHGLGAPHQRLRISPTRDLNLTVPCSIQPDGEERLGLGAGGLVRQDRRTLGGGRDGCGRDPQPPAAISARASHRLPV
jgi:hypothetical protein